MKLSKTKLQFLTMALLTIVSLSYLISTAPNTDIETSMDGILEINIDIVQDSILLSIKIDKGMTCAEVIEKLNVIDLPFKNKVYKPMCEIIDYNLVKIYYKSSLTI
jgi:hypothetical protein